MRSLVVILFILISSLASAQVSYKDLKVHRYNGLDVNFSNSLETRPACRDFIDYTKSKMNTYGVIAYHKGKAIFEYYDRGANKENLFKLWSISKTVSGLTLGALIQKKMTSLDTYLSDYIDLDIQNSDHWTAPRQEIKMRHTWNMTTGLDWCEYSTCSAVDPLILLYGRGRDDGVSFTLKRAMNHMPGKVYNYSAGNYSLMSAAMKKIVGDESYSTIHKDFLFDRIGIKKYSFEQDDKGVFLGGAGLSLSLRSFAHLGQLILQKGSWDGEQILTPQFYEEMITLNEAIKGPHTPQAVKNWEGPVGSSLWLNKKFKGVPQFFKTMPEDMIYSGGNFGQFLLIFPSAELVIARVGADLPHSVHWEPFGNKALKCFAPGQLQAPLNNDTPSAPDDRTGLRRLYDNLSSAAILFNEGVLVNSRAQEICQCLFVGQHKNKKTCEDLNPLPKQAKYFNVKVDIDRDSKSVTSKLLSPLGIVTLASATSQLNEKSPHLGCQFKKKARGL